MADYLIPVRKVAMLAMVAHAPLVAAVPAASIFPQKAVPGAGWTAFIRCGAPSGIPLRASCVRGASQSFAVHSFAKPRVSGGQVVETAEDHAGRIGSLVTDALDGKILSAGAARIKLRSTGFQLLMDPEEADCFHHVAEFSARVLA
jgi:hypothetical protein